MIVYSICIGAVWAGVGATIFLLWRLGGSRPWDLWTMALVTFLLSFDPLHQAFHLGNVALLVVPLVFWAILLAENTGLAGRSCDRHRRLP